MIQVCICSRLIYIGYTAKNKRHERSVNWKFNCKRTGAFSTVYCGVYCLPRGATFCPSEREMLSNLWAGDNNIPMLHSELWSIKMKINTTCNAACCTEIVSNHKAHFSFRFIVLSPTLWQSLLKYFPSSALRRRKERKKTPSRYAEVAWKSKERTASELEQKVKGLYHAENGS